MRLQLTYDQISLLTAVLEDQLVLERVAEISNMAVHDLAVISNTLRKDLQQEWNRGSQLTPIHAPFVVLMKETGETFLAVRKEHCSSYAPETVKLIRQDKGEEIVLKSHTFDWRYR